MPFSLSLPPAPHGCIGWPAPRAFAGFSTISETSPHEIRRDPSFAAAVKALLLSSLRVRVPAIALAFFCVHPPYLAAAQGDITSILTSPSDGQVLHGQVHITGTADAPDFGSAELSFAYTAFATATWFEIQTIDQPILDAELGSWDSTAISDGDYVLRLRVSSQSGSTSEAVVRVQVRNYTTGESASPTAVDTPRPDLQIAAPMSIVPSETARPPSPPTPTALPANPAALTGASLYREFWLGALLVGGFAVLVGMIVLRRRG